MMLLVLTITYAQDILINENFNGTSIPPDWRALATSDSGNGTQIWTFGSGVVPSGGSQNNFPTNAAIFNDFAAGNTGNHDRVWLWYRTPGNVGIDTTPYNDVVLEYQYALNVLGGAGETLTVGLWNGSDAFVPIKIYDSDTNPTYDSINITEALVEHPEVDPTAVYIGFGWDDGNGNWSFGAGIDNVVLKGYNPPSNDECINAVIIPANITITGTTFGATNIENLTPCQDGGGNGSCTVGGTGAAFIDFGEGVWFKYTSTSTETITISTANINTDFDTQLQVWSGTCGVLTCIGGDDDGGDDDIVELASQFCWQSTGSSANPVDYYIYVDGFSTNKGYFVLSLDTDQSTASNQEFEQFDFSIYPNPIKNILSIDSQEIITKVTIFNLLGQEVKTISPKTNNVSVDVNNLKAGVYIIKLIANDNESTKKFIKE